MDKDTILLLDTEIKDRKRIYTLEHTGTSSD
jgi:hypothetical protein